MSNKNNKPKDDELIGNPDQAPKVDEPKVPTLEELVARYNFQHIAPTAEGKTLLGGFRDKYEELLELLLRDVKPSRTASLAATHLETSLMYACKAIVESTGTK